MAEIPILKEYYIRYLIEIRSLSQSSVKHYIDALNNISRLLLSKSLVKSDIYEISNIDQLTVAMNLLYEDPEFKAQDLRGHQMYSSGLNNYYRFACGKDFDLANEKQLLFDKPIQATKAVCQETIVWQRSDIIRQQALVLANYQCEIDSTHKSFIAERTHLQYMEGHHAIPMHMQERFPNSLDVYSNIICLCPICHRRIHYGEKHDRSIMIQQLYESRSSRLANSGIMLSKEEFLLITG